MTTFGGIIGLCGLASLFIYGFATAGMFCCLFMAGVSSHPLWGDIFHRLIIVSIGGFTGLICFGLLGLTLGECREGGQ